MSNNPSVLFLYGCIYRPITREPNDPPSLVSEQEEDMSKVIERFVYLRKPMASKASGPPDLDRGKWM